MHESGRGGRTRKRVLIPLPQLAPFGGGKESRGLRPVEGQLRDGVLVRLKVGRWELGLTQVPYRDGALLAAGQNLGRE